MSPGDLDEIRQRAKEGVNRERYIMEGPRYAGMVTEQAFRMFGFCWPRSIASPPSKKRPKRSRRSKSPASRPPKASAGVVESETQKQPAPTPKRSMVPPSNAAVVVAASANAQWTSKVYVTEHAAQRMWERFNMNSNKIQGLITNAAESFDVTDRKLSYDLSVDLGRRKIVVARNPKAYFVIDHRNNVVTVLTEAQAMNNLKVGKWTKL